MSGSWTTFQPPSGVGQFSCESMLLLTDGSVLVHQTGDKNWLRLTPDGGGNYATGHWSDLLQMANTRQFSSSGVLKDGRVYVLGGEFSDAGGDTPLGELFDPGTNAWQPLTKPSGFNFIQGDASGAVLPDGRVLLGNLQSTSPPFKTAIWDPATDAWTVAGSHFGTLTADTKQSNCNEETWTLLPDGSVLTVNTFRPPFAERYVPWLDEWVSAGQTPSPLPITTFVDPQGTRVSVFEIGPAILLPDGRVFAIGATGQTALYTPAVLRGRLTVRPESWSPGPVFPPDTSAGAVWPTLTASDAPAVLQTNGRVLCMAGSLYETAGPPKDYYSRNMSFYEYWPTTNTLLPFPTPPFPAANAPDTWVARFLLLPTAQILLTTQSATIWLYTPDSASNDPVPSWRPKITACPTTLALGWGYTISGTQLNGLSQAVSYGDDAQTATNFPIIQLSNAEGDVKYLPTSNFSTMAVATGPSTVSASFDVTGPVAVGAWRLAVIANGIASEPVEVEVVAAPEDCLGLVQSIQKMLSDRGPKLTVAQEAAIRAQLGTCYREGHLTQAQYDQAVRELGEINTVAATDP
jgi:hypothetical protein